MTEPNTQDLDYQIATMTAAKNGVKIESRYRVNSPRGDWYVDPHPDWHWKQIEYRVVPETEPKTFWLVHGIPKKGNRLVFETVCVGRESLAAGIETFNYFVRSDSNTHDLALYEVVVKEKVK